MTVDGGFIHLRVRSAYSLLEGATRADALGKLAAGQGMPAVAIAMVRHASTATRARNSRLTTGGKKSPKNLAVTLRFSG